MNLSSWPSNSQTISLFIADMDQQGYRYTSIMSSLSAISFYHKLYNFVDPCKSFLITQMLTSLRKKGEVTDRRQPITPDILSRLVAAITQMGLSNYEVKLFQGLFLTAFTFGLRISEYTNSQHNLTFDNLSISQNSMSLNFTSFKHSSQDNLLSHIFNSDGSHLCPVKALNNYIQVRGATKGSLFTLGGKAVPRDYFTNILRRAVNIP